MPILLWYKRFPQDWISDPQLTKCSPAARGIWADIIECCYLTNAPELTGTVRELARLCRCTEEEFISARNELESKHVGDFIEQNGQHIIRCRRIVREFRIKDLKRKAGIASATQRQHRSQQDEQTEVPAQSPTPSASASASASKEGGVGGLPPVKDLPAKLNTARMQNKWQVWQNFRRGKGKVKDWPTLFNEQIDWLEQFDEESAFEILSASIRNGWQGLFAPKNNHQGGDQNSQKPIKAPTVFELKEIIKAKETQAVDLKLKHCSEMAMGEEWSDPNARKQFFDLKREIKNLNQRIASAYS